MNIVTQITEPEQTVVVAVDQGEGDVALLVFFDYEGEECRLAREPDEIIVLGASNAEALGHALIHAAHHADEDSGRPHLEVVPTEDGPA